MTCSKEYARANSSNSLDANVSPLAGMTLSGMAMWPLLTTTNCACNMRESSLLGLTLSIFTTLSGLSWVLLNIYRVFFVSIT